MRSRLAPVMLLAVLVGGCATSDATLDTPIDCDTDARSRLILFAQAVPTATAIPCLESLPPGWVIESIETRTGEAVVVFDNDTHDVEAESRFVAQCELADGAGAIDDREVSRHRTAAGGWAVVFPGGCFEILFPEPVTAPEAMALVDGIGHLTRDELRTLTGLTL